MKIIINGAGIAGQTLAYWLLQYGFDPTLVEQSTRLRTGGYMIDFWGSGFDVAEKMGLIPELMRKGYLLRELRLVNSLGKRCGGFSAEVFHELTNGRYVSLPRGDLAKAIDDKIGNGVKTIFSDSISSIEQNATGINVNFDQSDSQQFDLAIGADGLHSRVRELTFGKQEMFEKYLGIQIAAFEVKDYKPRDELVYIGYNRPGKNAVRFAMNDNRTMFFFLFSSDSPDIPSQGDLRAQKDILHSRFDNAGWECREIMEAMETCNSIYFDRVSQIRIGCWTNGRVTLLGDAAFCPSPLSGEGSGIAMTAAYILAGELYRALGNHLEAFKNYEETIRPFVAAKQKSAMGFASAFVPKTEFGIWFRNQMSRTMSVPILASLTIGRSLKDKITLPDYSTSLL